MRYRKLSHHHRRGRGEVQGQAVGRDDFRELPGFASACTPEHFEAFMLLGQAGSATYGPDDQVRQRHTGIDTGFCQFHVQLTRCPFRETGDILAGGRIDSRQYIAHVEIKADGAGEPHALHHPLIAGKQLLRRHLEHRNESLFR